MRLLTRVDSLTRLELDKPGEGLYTSCLKIIAQILNKVGTTPPAYGFGSSTLAGFLTVSLRGVLSDVKLKERISFLGFGLTCLGSAVSVEVSARNNHRHTGGHYEHRTCSVH